MLLILQGRLAEFFPENADKPGAVAEAGTAADLCHRPTLQQQPLGMGELQGLHIFVGRKLQVFAKPPV